MAFRKIKNLVGVNTDVPLDWIRRFKKVLQIQSKSGKEESMIEFLKKELSTIEGVKFYEKDKNIYITKTTEEKKDLIYPCMVAHTDTVHDIINSYHILRYEDTFFAWDGEKNKQYGTGGDDKCGIFVTLELLKIMPNMKACFFYSEEIGCIGSGKADLDFFKDCGFILQVDRKGNDDFCTTYSGDKMVSKDYSDTIAETIKKFGYSESWGGSTDVFKLKNRGLELCVSNMSSGYYEPHSSSETINITDVWIVFQMCAELFHVLRDKKWNHKVEKTVYHNNFKRHTTVHNFEDDDEESRLPINYKRKRGEILDEEEEEEETHGVATSEICSCCKKTEMIQLTQQYFCYECFKLFDKNNKKEISIN